MNNATERNTVRKRPDINRLMCDASSNSIGVERCVNILRNLKKLRLSVKDLGNCNTTLILSLQKLIDDTNPKINKEAGELFNSWIKILYSRRRSDPRSVAHEAKEIKPDVCKSVQTTSRPLLMKKHQSLKVSKSIKSCLASKKNSTEMLEMFDKAKNSADVANAKGFLASKVETSKCIDTLSLLISYPISATAPETRRIMERLVFLTNHKDRKICNSGLELLKHWRKSISDQQQH